MKRRTPPEDDGRLLTLGAQAAKSRWPLSQPPASYTPGTSQGAAGKVSSSLGTSCSPGCHQDNGKCHQWPRASTDPHFYSKPANCSGTWLPSALGRWSSSGELQRRQTLQPKECLFAFLGTKTCNTERGAGGPLTCPFSHSTWAREGKPRALCLPSKCCLPCPRAPQSTRDPAPTPACCLPPPHASSAALP